MESHFEVVIVGAGPAGSLLAHKLATAGFKTLLLEKNETAKRKVCGEYLCPLGVELLQREGLEIQILGNFLPLTGMQIFTVRGTKVDTSFPFQDRYRGVSVHRALLDSSLMDLARTSGAHAKMGVEVQRIERSTDQWALITNQGQFQTQVVVGADGRNSLVSKMFQNDIPNSTRRVALHALVRSESKNIRKGEMHILEKGAYVGLNPVGESEINFSLVLDAEDLRSRGGPHAALNFYLETSKNLSSRFPKFQLEQKITTAFPIQHRTKSVVPRPNIALIGDAAGFVDPLTGEGIYNALLSASLLAEELIADKNKNQGLSAESFKKYKRKYSKYLQQKTNLNRTFQRLIQHPLLIELVAKFLLTKQNRADIFIGIIGNIYKPTTGFFKMILGRALSSKSS